MNVVLYDAYNLIYRARHALPLHMQKTEWGVTFCFFRSLAALNRRLNPDLAYFVTEGIPVKRLQLLPEYKGTRVKDVDEVFKNQRREIIRMVEKYFPLVVANHPGHECDDIISHLAQKHASRGDTVTVASTDTDFLQLANTIKGYRQYNPIKKSYTLLPQHDYVAWKALVGDASDNIVGFHGIGNKRALSMLEDPNKLDKFLEIDGNRSKFELNKQLISFIDVSNEENVITFTNNNPDWDSIFDHFTKMNFKSMISEKGWNNFVNAFGGLLCSQ